MERSKAKQKYHRCISRVYIISVNRIHLQHPPLNFVVFKRIQALNQRKTEGKMRRRKVLYVHLTTLLIALLSFIATPMTALADGHCEAGADACLDEADGYDEVYDCMRAYEVCVGGPE